MPSMAQPAALAESDLGGTALGDFIGGRARSTASARKGNIPSGPCGEHSMTRRRRDSRGQPRGWQK